MKIKKQKSPDYLLVSLVILFSLLGLLMVYDASVIEAFREFGDKFYFAKLQLQWVTFGLLMMFLASFINYHFWQKIAAYLLLIAVLLLLLVLIPSFSQEIMGARRWLKLGDFTLQPGEFTKIAFITYFASWLSQKKAIKQLFIVASAVLLLLILEPDLGSAVIIISSGFLIYFVSGAPLFYLVSGAVLGLVSGLALILSSPYRKRRLLTFLNPSIDPQGASYHIRQILISLGSGGLWGLGIGKSRQKYEYLPAATTDSIFAILAEEIGFLGATFIILLFLLLIYRSLKIALQAPDTFGQLLAVGISSWISLQFFVNLAAVVVLAPFTGIPLPFISYGGSSIITALLGMGILLNISRYKEG